MSISKSPGQRRYPPELRQRSGGMVREGFAENGGERSAVATRVARQLGETSRCGPGSTRPRSMAANGRG